MRRPVLLVTTVCITAALAASPALAGPKKNKGKSHSTIEVSATIDTQSRYEVTVFAKREREIIRQYFADPKTNLPPGLAKKSSLPPGLQKQVYRTGQLPPGLQKRAIPLDLDRRLPPLDDRYERTIVGADLILLDRKTGLILDVMQEIFDVPVDATLQKVGATRVGH